MGVEIHLGAMVTDMDDAGRRDHQARRHRPSASTPPPRCGPPAPRAAGLGADAGRRRPGRRRTRPAGSRSHPDCSLPDAPRGVRRGRPDGARRPARRGRGGHAVGRPRRPHHRAPAGRASTTKPFRYRDLGHAGRDLALHRRGQDRPAPGRRLPRLADLARRAHHLPHRVQEPLRRAGPLDRQLRRARALRAGADRALGGPGEATRRILPKVRVRTQQRPDQRGDNPWR